MDNREFKTQLMDRAMRFSRQTIALINTFPNQRSAWVVGDQLMRSATSIGANIVEAQSASSRRDFINFLTHALKSGNETKYWLALTKDVADTAGPIADDLHREADELTRILAKSITTLKENRISKF